MEEESKNALEKKKDKLKKVNYADKKEELDLDKLPSSLEDINKNPILKPLLEYLNATKQYEQEDERETNYLNERIKELNELLDTGIYEDSHIAKIYKTVFDVYERLLWIYSRNVDLANDKIIDIKKTVEKYYILKPEKKEEKEILNEEKL